MLQKINNRVADYNNQSWISKSVIFTQIKLLYELTLIVGITESLLLFMDARGFVLHVLW